MSTEAEMAAQAERISQATKCAVRALGSSVRAIEWLDTENAAFDGRKPAAVAAADPEGLKAVCQVLGRIEYGVYS